MLWGRGNLFSLKITSSLWDESYNQSQNIVFLLSDLLSGKKSLWICGSCHTKDQTFATVTHRKLMLIGKYLIMDIIVLVIVKDILDILSTRHLVSLHEAEVNE